MLPCTFRQLEIFLAAAEDCHFARTADRLGISQPAVTNHIATLEDQLGKRLFVRRPGTTPVLSSDGVAFLTQARTFYAEGEKISAFRSGQRPAHAARVRIAAGQHILDDYVRPRLSDFYRDHAGLVVECLTLESLNHGFKLLERGAIDFFLLTTSQPCPPQFREEPLRQVRFRLYAAPAFEAHRAAGPKELSRLPFILPTEGSEPDRALQAALAEIGVVCGTVAQRAQFSDVILRLAVAGVGVAALYETMIGDEVERGALFAFDEELAPRRRTLFRRDEELSEAAAAVRDFYARILSADGS